MTPVVLVPVTVAANCCEPPAVSEVEDGESEILMPGTKDMVAVATFVGSAILAADTMIV